MHSHQRAPHAMPRVFRHTAAKFADRGLRAAGKPGQIHLAPTSRHQVADNSFPIHARLYRYSDDLGNCHSDSISSRAAHSQCMRAIEPTTPAGRLRAARKARGLSQVAVAELTGLSQAAVSESENAHPPTMLAVTMAALCGALGVTLEFVMHGNAAEKTAQEAEILALLRQASPDMRDAALRTLRALLAPPATDGKRRAA